MGFLERLPIVGPFFGGGKGGQVTRAPSSLEQELGLPLRMPYGASAGIEGPFGSRVESGGAIRVADEFVGDPVLASGVQGMYLDDYDMHAEARGTVQLDGADEHGPRHVRLRGSFSIPGGFSGKGSLRVGPELQYKKKK